MVEGGILLQGVCQPVRVTKHLNLQDLWEYDMEKSHFLDKNQAEMDENWSLM